MFFYQDTIFRKVAIQGLKPHLSLLGICVKRHISQMLHSSILTVLGITNCWFSWRTHPHAQWNSDANSVWQLQSTSLLLLVPQHRELGIAKTCSRSHPNLTQERSQFTSALASYNQKIGLTPLPIIQEYIKEQLPAGNSMVHVWSGGRYCLTRMMQSNFNVHFKIAITATATKEKYKRFDI